MNVTLLLLKQGEIMKTFKLKTLLLMGVGLLNPSAKAMIGQSVIRYNVKFDMVIFNIFILTAPTTKKVLERIFHKDFVKSDKNIIILTDFNNNDFKEVTDTLQEHLNKNAHLTTNDRTIEICNISKNNEIQEVVVDNKEIHKELHKNDLQVNIIDNNAHIQIDENIFEDNIEKHIENIFGEKANIDRNLSEKIMRFLCHHFFIRTENNNKDVFKVIIYNNKTAKEEEEIHMVFNKEDEIHFNGKKLLMGKEKDKNNDDINYHLELHVKYKSLN